MTPPRQQRRQPRRAAGGTGLAKWAHSTLGTQEGSRLESRWARESGISPTTAWCAAFVAAGLRRLGITPPASAASVNSWFTWRGGENVGKNLRNARPGDLLGFDWGDGGIRDHIAIYIGGGMMISGNDHNNSVGVARVPAGNLVGIIRPKAFAEKQSRFFQFGSPEERKKFEGLTGNENLGEGVLPGPDDIASEVVSGIVDTLSSHAGAFTLNVALIGGGAFLVYYGAALMLGVRQPVASAAAVATAPK